MQDITDKVDQDANGTVKIEEFEQIPDVDLKIVKSVLEEIEFKDIVLACRGTSPDNRLYIGKLFEDEKLEEAIKNLGAVPIAEIEKQQLNIIQKINEKL